MITGGGGFVGRHMCGTLTNLGHRVRPFDPRRSVHEDVRDYEAVRRVIEEFDPDRIFHLAAPAYVPESGTNPIRSSDIIVSGTLNLLEAVRQTGSGARILLAGTSEEYGYEHPTHQTHLTEETTPRPTTLYGVLKLAAGLAGRTYAQAHDMNVVCTRAFNHTGPRQSPIFMIPAFARRVAEVMVGRSDYVEHGRLDVTRNYTDVRDVVRAYVQAIELPSGTYNVCSENNVDGRWVLDRLIALADRGNITLRESPRLMRHRPVQMPIPSCDRLRELTGWRAETPLEHTLEDVLRYWRDRL